MEIKPQNFEGTVKRGSITCPCCGFTTSVKAVRKQLQSRRGGTNDARLFCVVTTKSGEKGRHYRLPNIEDLMGVEKARKQIINQEQQDFYTNSLIPDEPLPPQGALGFRVQLYGMKQWGDIFTSRQLLALTILSRLVRTAGIKLSDNQDKGLDVAIQVVLSLCVSKIADVINSLVTWQITMDRIRNLFARQAVPMAWDFAETSPVSGAAGDYSITIKNVLEVLDQECNTGYFSGSVENTSAFVNPLPSESAQSFFSDPPYYDAVQGYFILKMRLSVSKPYLHRRSV